MPDMELTILLRVELNQGLVSLLTDTRLCSNNRSNSVFLVGSGHPLLEGALTL